MVENKAGRGRAAVGRYVAREPADGYTVLVGASGAMAIGPLIYKTDYDTLKSFTPVTMIGDFPLFLAVGTDHPAKTAKDLVDWTKANADKANYATSSPAFTLPSELFKMKSGANGTAIPYKSSGESILAVISGDAAMTIVDPPPMVPQVQGGKLQRAGGAGEGALPDLPDVPTMTEAGFPDVNVSLWSGFFVPAGTPKPIVDKLHKELNAVITQSEVQGQAARAWPVKPTGTGTEEFSKIIAEEQKMWCGVIKARQSEIRQLKFAGTSEQEIRKGRCRDNNQRIRTACDWRGARRSFRTLFLRCPIVLWRDARSPVWITRPAIPRWRIHAFS